MSPRERTHPQRNAKHGQERDCEPFEFNLEQMNSKCTKSMVQGNDSIPKTPKIKEDSISHDGNDNKKNAKIGRAHV